MQDHIVNKESFCGSLLFSMLLMQMHASVQSIQLNAERMWHSSVLRISFIVLKLENGCPITAIGLAHIEPYLWTKSTDNPATLFLRMKWILR
jgi:hypothetical protein